MFYRTLFSGLILCGFAAGAAAQTAACPNPPVASVTSGKVPADVCIPAGFTDLTIDFFDDYSWKAFVALTSPGPFESGAFENYKALWETFHEDGSPPGGFESRGEARDNACAVKPGPGDMILASFSGFHDIGQVSDGALIGPLAAQNGRYVRYLTAYNDIAYNHIVAHKWYLRSNLPEVPVPRPPVPPVQFPDGSVVVKSAWVEMTGFTPEQRARFHTRTAILKDPDTGKCAPATIGLVGLHIVQKTASRPQWIWSSFEQADPFTFHDGTPTPMPEANPLKLIPLAKQPVKPFNVERSAKLPIHPRTAATNAKYRQLLAGSVWANYQLVVTQWPLAPGDQSVPVAASQAGDIFQTFPGEGATSTFANMTMETFNQNRPAQGCMNCHNRARLTADFMWSVFMHAYPAKIGLPEGGK